MSSGRVTWLVLAAFGAGCGAGDHYELSLSPALVTAGVIDTFYVEVTTDFASEPPIFTTTVEITLEPAVIVSTPGDDDVSYDPSDTNPAFDAGPPPAYSFRPGDVYGGVTTQRIRFRCLTSGDVVASFATTWVGGNPDDLELTVEHAHGDVAIACQ